MAQRGKPLDAATRRTIVRLVPTMGIKQAARYVQVARNTARKYFRKNLPSRLAV
jgi:hypothetical protein